MKRKRQVIHAPTADNPVGTVVEEHLGPKPKNRHWPYGRFQIFTNGYFVCTLDLHLVVENRESAYRSVADLSQAIAEVCNVPVPTMTPALSQKLLAKARKLAKDADSEQRSRRMLGALQRDMFAPQGYTAQELQEFHDWH